MTLRRLKTYTAETGHVYEYYFVGQRPAVAQPATEYIFDVIKHDQGRYSVSVFLPDAALQDWQVRHGRALSHTECYACAKLRLLQGFDQLEDVQASGREIHILPGDIENLLALLNLD